MPLVAIHLSQGSHDGELVGAAVQTALIDALGVPPGDHFQILRTADTLIFDDGYLGIRRTGAFLIIQIFLARGRSVGQKQALYKRIATLLSEYCQIRPEDVFVNLVEVGAEDFSFGCGLAQYADRLPPHLPAPQPN